ncbi:MAG TPA: sigma-70 family RNA polymerase sigma factor [Bryobacteraceae bacterium]|nr:sigma-70 family RNA polymerase sigma factor [Bryobacteraceae bacterium]
MEAAPRRSREQTAKQFEDDIVPWLSAAFSLARWVTGNRDDAEDVVQEACLRAFRALDALRPAGDARAWLLAIVRNASCDWLRRNRRHLRLTEVAESAAGPDVSSEHQSDVNTLSAALRKLPPELREVIELRALSGMSYREIAKEIDAPLGTVMSRLSRGRKALRAAVTPS